MNKSLWILVVGTLILATGTGVAVGKGAPASSGNAPSVTLPPQAKPPAQAQAPASGGGSTSGTSGDPTAPQPLSNADLNPGGANNGGDCAPYCSTRDGSPSQNGNGGGKATGKPCAGCVGKADNKRPQGQLPTAATDGNRGYECDDNKGIGKGNPAHTACTTQTRPPVPPPTPPTIVPSTKVLPLITPAVVQQTPALVPASNQVLGKENASPKDVAENQALEQQRKEVGTTSGARELAFTGLGLAWMALLGFGFLVAGQTLRRRQLVGAGVRER